MHTTEATYFIWETPGKKVAVHLRRSIVEWIDEQVKTAFKSIPKRGAETGGLLVGSKVFQGGKPVIIVESAEEIECEHRSGPSFILSDHDQQRLSAQMQRIRGEGLVVVGYYRSHTRDTADLKDLTLSAEDRGLVEAWSPGSASVFLVLRPYSMARVMGNLFFWHEGRLSGETDFIEFPFGGRAPLQDTPPVAFTKSRADRSTTADVPVSTMALALRPSLTDAPALEQAGAIPDLSFGQPPIKKRRFPHWAYIVLFALAGAATGYKIVTMLNTSVRNRVEAEQRSVPFELAADRVRDQLVLRWNPNHPGLRNAQEAGLIVSDGGRRTRYTLDREQLLEGSMSYRPAGSAVTFSLETRSEKGQRSRGVLVVIDPSR